MIYSAIVVFIAWLFWTVLGIRLFLFPYKGHQAMTIAGTWTYAISVCVLGITALTLIFMASK